MIYEVFGSLTVVGLLCLLIGCKYYNSRERVHDDLVIDLEESRS